MTIGLGIIGLGTMGQFVLDGALTHPDFEVVSVYEPSLISLAGETDKYVAISCETTAIALIERADVDVVYIASPPNTHIEYCRLVLKAAKALWCEKPLAVDVDDAAAFVAELESQSTDNKLKAVVNLSLATSPELAAMKAIIDGEQLGRLSHVDIKLQYSAWLRVY